MKTILSLSMLAAMLTVTLPTAGAFADDHDGYRNRERCSTVRRCHREDGRRVCERVRVCGDRH